MGCLERGLEPSPPSAGRPWIDPYAKDTQMMRLIRYLLLLAVVAFGLWPYYHVFRLDAALGNDDLTDLAGLVDLKAIQRNYKQRLDSGLGGLLGEAPAPMGRVARGLDRLGEVALEQYITLPWVQERLREATRAATQQSPPYLIGAVTFAFFESYDRFLIRLGELGQGATHIRMRLERTTWRVTDIIQ